MPTLLFHLIAKPGEQNYGMAMAVSAIFILFVLFVMLLGSYSGPSWAKKSSPVYKADTL
jgi:hypothetical protein